MPGVVYSVYLLGRAFSASGASETAAGGLEAIHAGAEALGQRERATAETQCTGIVTAEVQDDPIGGVLVKVRCLVKWRPMGGLLEDAGGAAS